MVRNSVEKNVVLEDWEDPLPITIRSDWRLLKITCYFRQWYIDRGTPFYLYSNADGKLLRSTSREQRMSMLDAWLIGRISFEQTKSPHPSGSSYELRSISFWSSVLDSCTCAFRHFCFSYLIISWFIYCSVRQWWWWHSTRQWIEKPVASRFEYPWRHKCSRRRGWWFFWWRWYVSSYGCASPAGFIELSIHLESGVDSFGETDDGCCS